MGRLDFLINRIGHTVQVERFEGNGATGRVYAEATTETCYVERGRTSVRTPDNKQVVAVARLFFKESVADIPAESRITVDGVQSEAIAVYRRDAGGLPTPNHVEVAIR